MHLTSANGAINTGVTQNGQLLTVQIAPANVINVTGHSTSTCSQLYLPPAGKAVVVTSVTWASGTVPSGQAQEYAELDGVAEVYSRAGSGDLDVQVLDDHQDAGAGVASAEPHVVEPAVVADGEFAVAVDGVVANPAVGFVLSHPGSVPLPSLRSM